MKIRSQSLTALRALLDLCLYSAPQVPTSLSEIARRQQLSAAFLEQLFRKLKAAGLVQPSRGMKGGYILAKASQSITLLDVFQALGDPLVAPPKQKSDRAEAEILLSAFAEASGALEKRLGEMTLEDLRKKALEHPGLKGVPPAGAGFAI